MEQETIQQLISFIQEVAPELWRIAIREVYVRGLVNLFVVIVSLPITIFCIASIRNLSRKHKDMIDATDIEVMWLFVAIVLIAVGGLTFVLCSLDAIRYLLSPEYHAIRVLLELIP